MSEHTQQLVDHWQVLKANAGDIASYSLPELPETDAFSVYERILEADDRLTRPATAEMPESLYTVLGSGSALLTGEHATPHMRAGTTKAADEGTAGLGQILHEDTGAGFVMPYGRQNGDANYDPEHPLKSEVQNIMTAHRPLVVSGLHGIVRGKFNDITDTKAYDVILGLGNNPNQVSKLLAEAVRAAGAELDLRIGINESHIRFKDGMPVLDGNGQLKRTTFKAAGVNTTRSHAERTAAEIGYEPALMQVEMSSFLRMVSANKELDKKSRVMGVYLGYLVGKSIVDLAQSKLVK